MQEQLSIPYTFFNTPQELAPDMHSLLEAATDALQLSYAPYSNFKVACAVLLADGTIIKGANQENASYSLTICAERTALSVVSSVAASSTIVAMAITYQAVAVSEKAILSPCGACRQHILEFEQRQQTPIAIYMMAPDGSGIAVKGIKDLLPFAFTGAEFLANP